MIRVRERGQITLPAALCKQIGITAGDYVELVIEDNGTIVLRPKRIVDAMVRKPKKRAA